MPRNSNNLYFAEIVEYIRRSYFMDIN
ncbi:hypothetical protein KM92DES2_10622 [uncultured Desulfovibrio sp.]|uniref:Uncharacterized protein n=1 Tax=uncultured Desulfovibrio sp. TaxID=167968 RepID=A0A212J6U0_9BACT|nr:hypothetical protein KM92DES2_10622 [uncultured Desulfovibrio sp.]